MGHLLFDSPGLFPWKIKYVTFKRWKREFHVILISFPTPFLTIKQVTSVYFLNTHFTRTSCNSSQVCTEGSKDPNHQCINIALILCFNQLHCYVGGKQGPQLSVQMNIPCCRLCCIVQCHTHITPVAPSCTKLRTTQCTTPTNHRPQNLCQTNGLYK